jgi:hypothetical protein
MRKMRNQESFTIDTTNILFIGSGAFNGLEALVADRKNKGVSCREPTRLRAAPASLGDPARVPAPAAAVHRLQRQLEGPQGTGGRQALAPGWQR